MLPQGQEMRALKSNYDLLLAYRTQKERCRGNEPVRVTKREGIFRCLDYEKEIEQTEVSGCCQTFPAAVY